MFCWILASQTSTSPYSRIAELIHHKEKCQGSRSSGFCCHFSSPLFISFTLTFSKGAPCLCAHYRDHLQCHACTSTHCIFQNIINNLEKSVLYHCCCLNLIWIIRTLPMEICIAALHFQFLKAVLCKQVVFFPVIQRFLWIVQLVHTIIITINDFEMLSNKKRSFFQSSIQKPDVCRACTCKGLNAGSVFGP